MANFMVICVQENHVDSFKAICVFSNESDNFIALFWTYGVVFSVFEPDEETLLSVCCKKTYFPIFFMAEIPPIAVDAATSAGSDDLVEKPFFVFNDVAAQDVFHLDFHSANWPYDFNRFFRDNQPDWKENGTSQKDA